MANHEMLSWDTRVQKLREAVAAQTGTYLSIDGAEAILETVSTPQREPSDAQEWEYGVTWLEGSERVYMPVTDDWRAGVEVKRMNQGHAHPEENYVVRRRRAGCWETAPSS